MHNQCALKALEVDCMDGQSVSQRKGRTRVVAKKQKSQTETAQSA